MTVIAPSSSGRNQIEEIMITVSEQQYYTLCKLPLTKLISVEFIEAFVKRGCESSFLSSTVVFVIHILLSLFYHVHFHFYSVLFVITFYRS